MNNYDEEEMVNIKPVDLVKCLGTIYLTGEKLDTVLNYLPSFIATTADESFTCRIIDQVAFGEWLGNNFRPTHHDSVTTIISRNDQNLLRREFTIDEFATTFVGAVKALGGIVSSHIPQSYATDFNVMYPA
jgi:hypothetical protein